MFGIGSGELILIIIVALLVLGPSKLPELMRALGKGIAEFKRMSSEVTVTLDREIQRADQERRKEEATKELFPDGIEPMRTAEAAAPEAAAAPAPQPPLGGLPGPHDAGGVPNTLQDVKTEKA